MQMVTIPEGGKGGGGLDHVSWKIKRSFNNSRKTKPDIMKITVHDELNIYFSFYGK